MAEEPAPGFGLLLRRARRAVGLTQEGLAERAGLSPRVISELERGGPHAPRKDTVALLAEALGLAGEERAVFAAAARPPHGAGVALASPPAAAAPGLPPLPQPPTPLLGRELERAALTHLLQGAAGRLLTLTGPGGVGKTRLALQVAEDLQAQGHFPGGVAFVALAPLRDSALVAGSIAQVLGLRETGSRPLVESLVEYLQDKHLLLLLDNFEQLLAAAPLVAEVLAGCARLVVLVTSRAALRLRGEQQYALEPLALPDPARADDPAVVGQAAAVRLFVQRAQAVRADFALTAQNAAAVAAICVRLEGFPLALELAAARSKVLPPAALLARLERRLPLLTGGAPDAPERQRTMRATIAWSYDLLHAGEQSLLRRLSVFAGGCTLAAVEAVCRVGDDLAGDLLDWLGGLVDQSLLQVAGADEEPRFGMLETVREYGMEQLEAAGEGATMRDRHLAWCVALAEEAAPQLTGPAQGWWLGRLEAEHDNLRAALRWSLQGEGDAALGLRLAGALWRFWERRGHPGEGRGWLEVALAGASSASAASRAKALDGAGNLAWPQGDYGRAAALYEEALALYHEVGDSWGVAATLNGLAIVACQQADYGRAVALHKESLALRRALGDSWGVALSLGNLGDVVYQQGDYGRAVALSEESLALRRALGDSWGVALSLGNLGDMAYQQGDYGRAAALSEESLALRRALGDSWGVALSLGNLGSVAYQQGDYGRAAALYEEALQLSRNIGARDLVATGLEHLAWVAVARGQSQRAARLGGAAEALREALGAPLPPEQRAGHDQTVQAMCAALGEEAFVAAWAEGRALPLEEAIALALEGLADGS